MCRGFGIPKPRGGRSREHLHEKHFSDEERRWSPREDRKWSPREDKKGKKYEKKGSDDKEKYYKQYQRKAYDARRPGSFERYPYGQDRYFGGHQGCIHFHNNDQEWNRRGYDDFRNAQNFNRQDFRPYERKAARPQIPVGRDAARDFEYRHGYKYGPPLSHEHPPFDRNYGYNSPERKNDQRGPRYFEEVKEQKPLRQEYGKREDKKEEKKEERKEEKKQERNDERKYEGQRYEPRRDLRQPMYMDRRDGGYRGFDPGHRFIGW